MQSRLDPNVATPVRHAEATDSRMAIRQHEEQPRKKREEEQRDPLVLPEDVYDQAQVGVRALIDFLNGFLKSLDTPGQPRTSSPVDAATPAPFDFSLMQANGPVEGSGALTPPQVNPQAARAASAYQQTARTHSARTQTLEPDAAGAKDLLRTSEVRQIHELLAMLADLESAGVQTLTLEKADSFLNSLTRAASIALARIR